MTIIACSAARLICIYEICTHDDEFGFLQIKDFLFYSYCFEQINSGVLLGVMGTDVPLKELIKLVSNYKVYNLGFDVENNSNNNII